MLFLPDHRFVIYILLLVSFRIIANVVSVRAESSNNVSADHGRGGYRTDWFWLL